MLINHPEIILAMLILNTCAPALPFIEFSRHINNRLAPFSSVRLSIKKRAGARTPVFVSREQKSQRDVDIDVEDEEDDTTSQKGFSGRSRGGEDGKDFDKDPEFAEILGSCLDDPQKARSKVSFSSSWPLILALS